MFHTVRSLQQICLSVIQDNINVRVSWSNIGVYKKKSKKTENTEVVFPNVDVLYFSQFFSHVCRFIAIRLLRKLRIYYSSDVDILTIKIEEYYNRNGSGSSKAVITFNHVYKTRYEWSRWYRDEVCYTDDYWEVIEIKIIRNKNIVISPDLYPFEVKKDTRGLHRRKLYISHKLKRK